MAQITANDTAVFIGGPMDGQRKVILHSNKAVSAEDETRTIYRQTAIEVEGVHFAFWLAPGLTLPEAIAMLFLRYRPEIGGMTSMPRKIVDSYSLGFLKMAGRENCEAYYKIKRARAVLISSSGGFWREKAQGYCHEKDAGVFTGNDALDRIWHLGPEKSARIHILEG